MLIYIKIGIIIWLSQFFFVSLHYKRKTENMKQILIIMMLMVSAVAYGQTRGDSIKVNGKTYKVESVNRTLNLDTNSYDYSIETSNEFLITYSVKNGKRTNVKVKNNRNEDFDIEKDIEEWNKRGAKLDSIGKKMCGDTWIDMDKVFSIGKR